MPFGFAEQDLLGAKQADGAALAVDNPQVGVRISPGQSVAENLGAVAVGGSGSQVVPQLGQGEGIRAAAADVPDPNGHVGDGHKRESEAGAAACTGTTECFAAHCRQRQGAGAGLVRITAAQGESIEAVQLPLAVPDGCQHPHGLLGTVELHQFQCRPAGCLKLELQLF